MKRKTTEVRDFILENIEYSKSKNLPKLVVERFGISRQAAYQNLRTLVRDGQVLVEGSPRNRTYKLKKLLDVQVSVEIKEGIAEDEVWRKDIAPHLQDVKENVRDICHFGFTEMFNNVIDHSGAKSASVRLVRTGVSIRISIHDFGIGIWNKLQKECNLTDPHHAIFELSKGKLTTDPAKHTGEGIFFTSRMFDAFRLHSETLVFFSHKQDDGWLFDTKEEESIQGTAVIMQINLNSTKTTTEVFDKFASAFNDFGFTRTQVNIELAQYAGEQLISRSQAKRLLARLEQFKEVYLDFTGITSIGQAFADEIFRVFGNAYPDIHLWPCNMAPDVKKMVKRALNLIPEEPQAELPLT